MISCCNFIHATTDQPLWYVNVMMTKSTSQWWLHFFIPWWRHQMKIFSALLDLCDGNPPVTGGFPSQRPVMRSFKVFFDLRLRKRLSKQTTRHRLFQTPSRLLCRCCNDSLICIGTNFTKDLWANNSTLKFKNTRCSCMNHNGIIWQQQLSCRDMYHLLVDWLIRHKYRTRRTSTRFEL